MYYRYIPLAYYNIIMPCLVTYNIVQDTAQIALELHNKYPRPPPPPVAPQKLRSPKTSAII
jgi:hypothetical protein